MSTFNAKAEVKEPTIQYRTHVQDFGWQEFVSSGEMSGTSGEAKRLESIEISIDSELDLGIKYSTHVQDRGWLTPVSNGKPSGTVGEAKRLEAIKIELNGEQRTNYDIYYRVHAETYGWLSWAKNGEPAGTEGQGKRLEAIEILLVKRGDNGPVSTGKAFMNKPIVVYSTHVQDFGWMNTVKDGKLSGTSGKAKRLEGIKIDLKDSPHTGNIVYSTHVQDFGWMKDVKNNVLSGTTGSETA